ncbi:FAD-binding oxidoreductase [Amycolatopsis sp. CA-230715]|uniref:FAD-binding oxidoreductase n=1 Tax=Amycolatopsis sp. CA-230715 TaxID=2745196 RepID=UPI001C010BCB|nr:FAD-binding oxidoreductase [Amycolatopsis sp. CA-230715]QWF84642.1 3-ketosteroid-9-alpha-monooxygenase, ferredoxin reductase component [Amycolatopsis sp. CA-230715]
MKNSLCTMVDHADRIRAEIDERASGGAPRSFPRTVAAINPDGFRVTVTDVVAETASAKTFRFERAGQVRLLPPFLAGQYVSLHIGGTTRPFAISSSPAQRAWYDITVRRVPGGRISNHLIDRVGAGDTLTMTGPSGTFHHNPLFHGSEVVFLAGGSGVAPAMSMLREIVDQRIDRRFHLVYGCRSDSDVIFREELDELAERSPNIEVDYVITDPGPDWRGPTGLLSAEVVESLTGPLRGRMVYVCGPQALYSYALDQLTGAGHPRNRIRFEANGAPADVTAQSRWPAGVDPSGEVTVSVGAHEFRTPRNRPLLDALEAEGIRPNASCRSGECGQCRIRVLGGEIYNADEARLRMSDEWFGYTHSCVGYPLTDTRLQL